MTDDLKRYMPQAKLAPKTRGPGYRYIGVMNDHPEGKWVRLEDVALLRIQAADYRARAEAAEASDAESMAMYRRARDRAKAAEAEVERLRLTPNDLYYLRAIDRRMREISDALEGIDALTIGGEAFADERDWLDCFITRAALKDGGE